jgi:superfamily II DNA/RNA helicase
MERALNAELLNEALGVHAKLPTPDELGDLLARAEIDLFFGADTEHERLLISAWYLHAIAAARRDNVDGLRRARAGAVSAHIFDVYLQGSTESATSSERLRSVVAAQFGYTVGQLAPNAIALGAQVGFDVPAIAVDPGSASLHAAVLLLALDRRRLRLALDVWLREAAEISQVWEDISLSPFASAFAVINGIRHAHNYLTTGQADALVAARNDFDTALTAPGGQEDTDSRWVAALMSDLGDDLSRSSVFSVLPPDLHPTALALVRSDPSVLMFWPPQEAFLRSDPSPLDPTTRRQVLAFPTSAGKTLVSQVLIMSHVQQYEGDVCVVAPTHSLCREIQEALAPRLNLLHSTVTDAGPGGAGRPLTSAGRVVVMTPERLAGLVRSDPDGFLERFTLFVIDEAHLLAERERGWGLEEALTLIHHLTRNTAHRLVLVSAAMGTDAHVVSWIEADEPPLVRSNTWRGPRRLYAIYTTELDNDKVVVEEAHGSKLARRNVPVSGRVHLRQSRTHVVEGRFEEPVGTHIFRQKRNGDWVTDSSTTSQLNRVEPLIHHLVENRKTATLAIVAIREDARKLASLVAARLPDVPELSVLAARVSERVGENHLLPGLIRKGVAYHHGALPTDVQAEIEDAARAGSIRCLVATATLTEGVNLPFKAVVIASVGYGNPNKAEDYVTVIDAPRLVNALGRAGRACRETEAWLFLVRHKTFAVSMFEEMSQEGTDLILESSLISAKALSDLEAFELLVAAGADAVFRDTGPATNGFCAFVWHVAELLEQQGTDPELAAVMAVVEESLAWTQADDPLRERWRTLVAAASDAYMRTDGGVRRRWARSGASLAGAAALENLRGPTTDAVLAARSGTVAEWLEVLLGDGRLQDLLDLPENRLRYFRPHRTAGAATALDVDLVALLLRWVAGAELEQLGREFLTGIPNEDYRAEALSEFTSTVFEHHLPWVLATLTEWVNTELAGRGAETTIPPLLASYIHFGVSTPTALNLMLGGVRSRRLAQAVASVLGADVEDLRSELTNLGIQGWREAFNAHPAELRDLLTFVRRPPDVLAKVLGGESFSVGVVNRRAVASGSARVRAAVGVADPAPLEVVVDGTVVGQVIPDRHVEVQQLIDLGLELDGQFDHEMAVLTLSLKANDG